MYIFILEYAKNLSVAIDFGVKNGGWNVRIVEMLVWVKFGVIEPMSRRRREEDWKLISEINVFFVDCFGALQRWAGRVCGVDAKMTAFASRQKHPLFNWDILFGFGILSDEYTRPIQELSDRHGEKIKKMRKKSEPDCRRLLWLMSALAAQKLTQMVTIRKLYHCTHYYWQCLVQSPVISINIRIDVIFWNKWSLHVIEWWFINSFCKLLREVTLIFTECPAAVSLCQT